MLTLPDSAESKAYTKFFQVPLSPRITVNTSYHSGLTKANLPGFCQVPPSPRIMVNTAYHSGLTKANLPGFCQMKIGLIMFVAYSRSLE